MIRTTGIVLLLVTAALVSFFATAGPSVARDPCSDDVRKYCGKSKRGRDSVDACLRKNELQLSTACAERRAALGAGKNAFRDACKMDANRYCKGVKGGRSSIIRCLREHERDLGPICRGYLSERAAGQ
jgi:hypothetical protein